MRWRPLRYAAAATALLFSEPVGAHAFGARYDLPLPLELYIAGAGAAVALSFVVLALTSGVRDASRAGRIRLPLPNALPSVLRVVLGTVSLLVLGVVAAAAFLGPASTTRNLAPTFVWVVWWVGLAFVQALVGDLWSLLDPWRALAGAARAGARLLGRTLRSRPLLRWPRHLGYWPAALGFLVFAWLELVSGFGEQPRALGWLIVGYSVYTLCGMALFGPLHWRRRAETFSVVFGVLARFAPVAFGRAGARPALRLRLPGSGLLEGPRPPLSLAVAVVALLCTVSFDGLLETSAWAAAVSWVERSAALRPLLLAALERGVDLLALVKSVGLLASVVGFGGAYLLVALLMARLAGGQLTAVDTARRYVMTLVPIAIAYHLSHYLSYLLIAGQLAIPAASDPFGLGWDLLGTRNRSVDIAVIDARAVWNTALASIVTGHVISVWLAHRVALRSYRDRAAVLRSQIPMLVLMVLYTMSSLWILSQPIVTL